MRVLVTGGSGMLGGPLTKRLSLKHEVTALSKSGRLGTQVCDLTRQEEVAAFFQKHSFDLVIHTAAYSDVDGCERDPQLAHASNALSTKYLSQSCGRAKAAFIYVSTDYVFDGSKNTPYEVKDLCCPVNIYGLTKWEGEFHATKWAPFSAVVRTSWLFGSGNPASFVNAIIQRLRSEKMVRVLDDQTDAPTYVEDLSVALEKIGEHWVSQMQSSTKKNLQEVFQVCNSGSATRLGMTLKIKDWLRVHEVQVERLDKGLLKNRLAVRPAYGVMSARSYEEFFGVKMRGWEESLREYIEGPVLCGS